MMYVLAFLPLLLQLSISGCLPLYHALLEATLERNVSALPEPDELVGPVATAQSTVAATYTSARKSGHFCAVCAFTKGMNGASLVARGQLLPPFLASSALAFFDEATPFWNTLRPVSRAPPTPRHG